MGAAAAAGLLAVVAVWALAARQPPGAGAGTPAGIREVALPDIRGEGAELRVLARRTGSVVVAVQDGRADFVRVDDGTVGTRALPQLAPGDPPYRIVDAERLVLYRGDTVYVMDPDPQAALQALTTAPGGAVFVPSGVLDRVWVRAGRTDGAATPVSLIDVGGSTLIGPVDGPGGNLAVGLRDLVVLQDAGDRSGLAVWDARANEIVARVEGPFPMGTDGSRFAWCDLACRDLYVYDPATGASTLVARGADDARFAAYQGRFSPDGRFLAAPLCADGSQEPCALTVLDLVTDGTWTVAAGRLERGAGTLAWSQDGRWLFVTLDDARLAAYEPGTGDAAVVPVPSLDGVLQLGTMPADAATQAP